ncbi:fungal specific transcription factor domain-containing protein [Verticillium dahliae VdLs.17]|uniref:Fungal specific transcription factor domain-containing protein n=1 Tax=Verticillium dahliae (strain VdLs.17 / ATCC MYA-4575 / FGSC 10137) TaxID=498257 RepID=G2X6A5_VERDV|nr:fungal specific transcription factor domain-containing protein [Verticillium dahliae VdLs.17]EGY14523.1 fungal specific transcription factor domain-containing protein [Verticillium dahliae VdLs.17]
MSLAYVTTRRNSADFMIPSATDVVGEREQNVEHIAKTVDDLKHMLQNLRHEHPPGSGPGPTQHGTASAATLSRPSLASAQTSEIRSRRSPAVLQSEFGGESSISAHALFATTFLQNVVGNSHSPRVTVEMAPVMQTLSSIADVQNQTAASSETLFPHARPLEDGRKPVNFPTPAADKVFGCLRMAQEHDMVEALWLPEFESMGHFTEYVIKVCSLGPSSEAELIIFNTGMFWLFLECASFMEDEDEMNDYTAQSYLCRDNLETLLAHLGYHIPNTMDYIYALNMATTYCLQTIKTTAAWSFISTSAHACQALGLHSAVSLHPASPAQQVRKLRLFWAVYGSEKGLALRLGRSSNIRDSDITIPRPKQPTGPDLLINKLTPLWTQAAALQGRLYDEIYSPGAFLQPQQVRYERAGTLIEDLKSLREASEALEVRCSPEHSNLMHARRADRVRSQKEIVSQAAPGGQSPLSELCWRADRIAYLSMLTLAYRSLPPTDPFISSFAAGCIATARQALDEHEQCLKALSRTQTAKTSAYISQSTGTANVGDTRSLLQTPFVPFTILFCHAIETASRADLQVLRSFLDTLEGTAYSSRHLSTQNQLRLFQALYSVAVRYISVQESSSLLAGAWSTGGDGEAPAGQASAHFSSQSMASAQAAEDQFMANLGLQVDSSGNPLASWFARNQQLMRILENS